ncbi:MAG: hybrid sensor histidine kinase/response regulator [Phototrophicaceae bacterium]
MSDTELLNIFWEEVSEHLDDLNRALLQIEMISPDDDAGAYRAAVREMNRVAHSMKGAARAVGISVIETIAHYMEEVFSAAMNSGLRLSPDVCDTMYDSLDLIQGVASGEQPDETVLATVLASLEQMVADSGQHPPAAPADNHNNHTPEPAPTVSEQPAPPVPGMLTEPAPEVVPAIDPAAATVVTRSEESVRVTVAKLDRLMAEVTELFISHMHGEEQQRAVNTLRRQHTRWQREWRGVRTAYIRLVRRLQDQEQELGSELPILFRFLEFNQRQLSESNRLLAQIAQAVAQDNMRLSALADQLQDEIGGMRLVPFESILGGFQRMVRDLARDTGRAVTLDVAGAAVEIDKAVLELLKDPLMHLLRNAVDHGMESPAERVAAGKPESGRIDIGVEQRGSEIVLRVRDDGRGIDADSVRRAIVKNRLMSEAEAAALSDDEARSYIFYSGLTTSDAVTSLSGRGLGMDIVRDRVESLRGRVSVQSIVGKGTTVTLNVPVSLTRIRCILLRIGEQQFAVPSAMVIRMDRMDRSQVFTAEGREVLLINQRPAPLASLAAILGIASHTNGDEAHLDVLALQATDRAVAFEVDELYSEQELVLKPLGPELERARYVSGAAVMGTGDIIIVLDANDLVRRATGAVLPPRRAIADATAPAERRLRVLVVDDSITTRTLEKNILETAGFDVSVAINGVEAWAMLAQNDFDVIISDVEMPKMNGLELTSRIKGSERYQDLPVILLTSLGKPEQREAGLRVGADAYLVKSRFDQSELLQTIQSVV